VDTPHQKAISSENLSGTSAHRIAKAHTNSALTSAASQHEPAPAATVASPDQTATPHKDEHVSKMQQQLDELNKKVRFRLSSLAMP